LRRAAATDRATAREAFGRLRSIARKEVRQLGRDHLTLGFVIFVPLVQLVLFGYAINQDIRQVDTALLDRSQSAVSRRLAGQLEATQTFRFTRTVATEQEGRELIARGEVQAVVEVPPDFARRWYRGRGAEVSILVDATDPLVARAVRASADGLAAVLEARVLPFDPGGGAAARGSGAAARRFGVRPDLIRGAPITFSVLTYFNPELRTPVFVVPGLLGVILTTTMILLTSVALVRERERGTFEFLIGTPVRRGELMVGKLLPYVAIGLIQVAIVLAAGLVLFRVPIEGSLVALGIASLLFIAANLTLGLVISARVRSQLQATQIAFFFFLPSVLLSGFMFPFEAMPAPARWLGELLPLTHYIRLCRSILLRGTSLWDLGGGLAVLALMCAVGLVAATRMFRKELA
jgi:ABC-2 type transport system permease protein